MLVTQFCTYTGEYLDRPEGPVVWLHNELLIKLYKLAQEVPEAIPIMLALARAVGADGTIRLPQAEVAFQCNITIQKVRQAIDKFARAGLITDTVMSSEPEGTISCLMVPDYNFHVSVEPS